MKFIGIAQRLEVFGQPNDLKNDLVITETGNFVFTSEVFCCSIFVVQEFFLNKFEEGLCADNTRLFKIVNGKDE